MKQTLKLTTVLLGLALCGTHKGTAQTAVDAIDWSQYATTIDKVLTTDDGTPTYVLLYNKTAAATVGASNAFLTNGGDYGMMGTLTSVGNRFFITKPEDTFDDSENVYRLRSNMTNEEMGGNFFSAETFDDGTTLYMDRGPKNNDNNTVEDSKMSHPNWVFTYNSTNSTYTLTNKSQSTAHVYYNTDTGLVNFTTESNSSQTADEWYIITAESYHNAIKALAKDRYVEVSGLLADANFDRLNDDESQWESSTEQTEITDVLGVNSGQTKEVYKYYNHVIGADVFGTHMYDLTDWQTSPWNLIKAYGKDYCAGIWTSGSLTNKVENLPAGTYRISCTAFNTGSNLNDASFIVNNHKVPLPLLTDQTAFEDNKTQVKAKAAETLKTSADLSLQGADIIAAGQLLAAKSDKYLVDYYVEITDDDVTNSNNHIEFGFSNNYPEGTLQPVFADNFRLFYTNPEYAAYLSANNTTEANIDKYAYERPVELYLRRDFTAGTWNAIVLPFDISLSNLASNFGDDVRLSVLEGINPDRPTQIRFVSTSTLKAGSIGLIYVPEGTQPFFAYDKDSKKELSVLSAAITDVNNISTTTKQAAGPLYRIVGVTRSGDENGMADFESTVSGSCATSAGTLDYTGYYYKPKKDGKDTPWSAYSYIVEGGKMHHLTSDWGTVRGTMWQLKSADEAGAKTFTLEIDGVVEDETTLIEGVAAARPESLAPTYYNIGGQRVSRPHGLTIVRQADGTTCKTFVKD